MLLLENTLWGHTRRVTIDFNLMIASAGKLGLFYYAKTEAQIATHFLNQFHLRKFKLSCITMILVCDKKKSYLHSDSHYKQLTVMHGEQI